MKILVVGCGRWGSLIAWYLDKIGHEVTLYGRENSSHMKRFLADRSNDLLTLPESVSLTTDTESLRDAEVIVISIASQQLRSFLTDVASMELRDKTFVLCMKGLENKTGKRLSEVARECVDPSCRIAVWLGPGHVQEFYAGIPNCMVIDSEDEATKVSLVDSFTSNLIRFYYGTDLLGNEIGAAAKNVIGIAAGILDGLSLSSLKGALMSRGALEISRLIGAMGGDPASAWGLCHLGDYEATVFSRHSHNRRFGEAFVRGESFDSLAEGYYTVPALVGLAKEYGVELPICEAVYRVLYERADVEETLDGLFGRSVKREREEG